LRPLNINPYLIGNEWACGKREASELWGTRMTYRHNFLKLVNSLGRRLTKKVREKE
jgi:hypothetical protein